MIAIGIALFFIAFCWYTCLDYVPRRVEAVIGLMVWISLTLIVAGVVVFSWRYLP